MFGTVIFLVFIIFIIAAASDPANENPEVRLSYSNDGDKSYTVWKDKPLEIIIEHAYPRYVWCRSSFAKSNLNIPDFIPSTSVQSGIIVKLSVENVTAEMSTRWACTVLQNYKPPGTPYLYKSNNYTARDLYFNLHVRGARAVILSANSLTYIMTNLTVNYDGEASYTYVDGEDLEISCRTHDLDLNSALRLEYYNASGILLSKTKSRQKIPYLFRIVLKSDNNNDYLDCICATENPRTEYRYRTRFFKKKEDLQAGSMGRTVILYVNGQELTTVFHKDSSFDDYIFRYTDGVQLNVTCRKRDVQGPLFFYIGESVMLNIPILRSANETIISANLSTSHINNKTLTCGIDNSDVRKPAATILFLSDVFQYDVRLQGLPRKNILYQYTNDENQCIIEYQYSVNETLKLTCVLNTGFRWQLMSDENFFQWQFEGKFYDSPADELQKYPLTKLGSQQTFTKILDATHNGTKLQCTYFPYGKSYTHINRSVELISRLKRELVSEEISGESSTNNIVLLYSLSSVLGVAVCAILVIIIIFYKRSSIQQLLSPTPRPDPATVFYENLLSVFTPINEREARELENHYEEIQ